jgi:hypothetical protein
VQQGERSTARRCLREAVPWRRASRVAGARDPPAARSRASPCASTRPASPWSARASCWFPSGNGPHGARGPRARAHGHDAPAAMAVGHDARAGPLRRARARLRPRRAHAAAAAAHLRPLDAARRRQAAAQAKPKAGARAGRAARAPLAPRHAGRRARTFPVAGRTPTATGSARSAAPTPTRSSTLLAAQGIPVVAPTAGTVRFTDYQAAGAGEYVVLRSTTGPDYFFAHCVRGVHARHRRPGGGRGPPACARWATRAAPARPICTSRSGRTAGGRARRTSVPVDPLPQLRAWDR